MQQLEKYKESILHFHKSRELRSDSNFVKALSEAYGEHTGDKRTASSILQNCNSCISRAIDYFANVFLEQQNRESEVAEHKPKRKRINSGQVRIKPNNK
jgi:hypothetical protein